MKGKIPKDTSFHYHDGSVWNGFSLKQLKGMYPDGGYQIAGEVTKKKGKDDAYVVRNKSDDKLYLQPPGSYHWPIYRNTVYLPYKKDVYIAAKKLNLPFFLLSFVAAVVIILAVALAFNYQSGKPDIDGRASKYNSSLKRPADMDSSEILVPGYDDWTMKAGTDKLYMALMNPKDNPCYFQFTVVKNDNKEVLFKTKLVPPGSAVTEITLPHKMKQGIYPITVKIISYSLMDPKKKMNGAEIKTRIIALK